MAPGLTARRSRSRPRRVPARHGDHLPAGCRQALRDVGVEFSYQPKIASLALRIAKVASGIYQVGVASGHSHDWDIAAADLVLQEAGGMLADLAGDAIVYNKPDPSHGMLLASARAFQTVPARGPGQDQLRPSVDVTIF